jgi:urea transport system ATP-binding protein
MDLLVAESLFKVVAEGSARIPIESMKEYLRQRGDMAIVLVEQYLDFAHELADDFAVMDRGEVVLSGTRETFDVEAVRKHMTV